MFTVPAGKGGLYYFSASFVIEHSKFGEFEIQKKHQTLCSTYADARQGHLQTSCSAVTSADEGNLASTQSGYWLLVRVTLVIDFGFLPQNYGK